MKLINFLNRSNVTTTFAILAIITASAAVAVPQQYSNWSSPANSGSPVNTPALDGCPFISKDGLDLIFASNRAVGSGPTDLFVSHRLSTDSDLWEDPISLGSDINTAGSEEFCPMLTISGRYLFFVSNRPGGCGGNDLYVARRLSKKSWVLWGEPENLGCAPNGPNSAQNDITPSQFEDDDGTVYLYFSSNRPGGAGGMDIYVSTLGPDGTYGPANPVVELNTSANDQRPNIRVRDGLEIFFESNRTGSLGGSLDLYSSTRETTKSAWTAPVNLGTMVNSTANEIRPSLSFDGTELYFGSNRAGGLGDSDIYVVKRNKLSGKPE